LLLYCWPEKIIVSWASLRSTFARTEQADNEMKLFAKAAPERLGLG
jgi:hypothetical protein